MHENNPIVSVIIFVIYLVILVPIIMGYWKVYTKAGKPGWACIVPFYNVYVLLKMVNRPGWWLLLFLIPFVNIVISLIVYIDLAKAFGRSVLFGILALWLFNAIGMLILGFGGSKYVGVVDAPSQPTLVVPQQPQQPVDQTPPQETKNPVTQ